MRRLIGDADDGAGRDRFVWSFADNDMCGWVFEASVPGHAVFGPNPCASRRAIDPLLVGPAGDRLDEAAEHVTLTRFVPAQLVAHGIEKLRHPFVREGDLDWPAADAELNFS